MKDNDNTVEGVSPHDIGPNDVLSGRGGRVNSHEGNIRFRELVTAEKLRYLKTNKKKDKAIIAQDIVKKFVLRAHLVDFSKKTQLRYYGLTLAIKMLLGRLDKH